MELHSSVVSFIETDLLTLSVGRYLSMHLVETLIFVFYIDFSAKIDS
jgi:hypothetical protein